jgi:hypothetical protein
MALLRSRSAAADEVIDPHGHTQRPRPISTVPIAPFALDPECQRLSAQLHQLQRGIDEREQTLELYSIQTELSANTTLATGERKRRLRERETALKARLPGPKAKPTQVDGIDPIVAAGLRLAAGEMMPAPHDESAHKAQLRTELQQIQAALRLVSAQFDELRTARSAELAERLLPQQRAILRSKLDAALALSAACASERSLIAEVLVQGYEHCAGILTSPPLDGAARLGAATEWDSQVATYRRTLETLKVV